MKYHVLEKQRKIGIAKTATTRHSKNFSRLTPRAEWVTYYQGQNNSSERGDTVVLLWSGNAPRTYSSIEKIRAELTWATVMPDPNKCGRRNLRCCEETGHKPVHVTALSQRSFGRSPGKYYCQPCRENGHLVRFFQIKVVKNRRIWPIPVRAVYLFNNLHVFLLQQPGQCALGQRGPGRGTYLRKSSAEIPYYSLTSGSARHI